MIARILAEGYGPDARNRQDEDWIHLPGRWMPSQGWKLHVSAAVPDAGAVLEQVIPVLKRNDVACKVAASLHVLAELNEGLRGPSQVGKFITVYPNNDHQAVALARELDELTQGLRGPAIRSDRPLTPTSLVHYRYGAFRDLPLRTPLGEIVGAIRRQDGTLTRDERIPVYRQPEWVVDPFLAAGVSHEPEAKSLVVGGRYLVVSIISQSARGAVYLALDRQELRRCILKRATWHSVLRSDGQDARKLLRHEHAMLVRVAGCAAFPTPFELLEEGLDLYLVMEDVAGQPLLEACSGLPADQRARHITRWAIELAQAVGYMHQRGVVHGDIKPDNVIVGPMGDIRLIDFDLAFALDDRRPPSGAGSLGYQSPERAAGAKPHPLDDVFALGATLLAALSGAPLQFLPDPNGLAELPIESLSPVTPRELVQLVRRCLAPARACRPASMGEVGTCLGRMRIDVHPVPAARDSRRGDLLSAAERNARVASASLALRTGNGLVAIGIRHGHPSVPAHLLPAGTLAWRSAYVSSQHGVTGDLNVGVAGPVLALAELVDAFGEEHHRDALVSGCSWLLSSPRPAGPVAPGLCVGEAGVAVALLRAGQVLRDPALIEAATAAGRSLAELPHLSPDFYNGSAGRLCCHLLLLDETGDEEHLLAAIAAGEAIERRARREGSSASWTFPGGYDELSGDSRCLGYAHGAAGIGDVLLDLAEATGQERWLDLALRAANWLEKQALPWPAHGYGPDGRPALAWPRTEGDAPCGPAWCHGAAGIGRFLLKAYHAGFSGGLELSLGAAAATAMATHGHFAGQCHGQAGAIEFLLDVYQATGDPSHLAAARRVEESMRIYSFEKDGHLHWIGEIPKLPCHEYVAGSSGIALALLRLADPEGRPGSLSRPAFHHAVPGRERGGRPARSRLP